MNIACLDFEGVLVPEIWIGLAERTGIDDLKATTRDIPDYDQLMNHRLKIMRQRGIGFADIQAAADGLEPLAGAVAFLNGLRTEFQVVILSDTFYELAGPLIAKLDYPLLLCHRLEIDTQNRIVGYCLRQADPKRASVRAFKSLNYKILAAGDSYNDISMLEEADFGMLYCPPDNVIADHPEFSVARDYAELRAAFTAWSAAC